jgi:hypothetical protein
MMLCPTCKEEVPDEECMSYELKAVYDGISFYEHRTCGTVWSRWTGEIVPNWADLSWPERETLALEQKRKGYDG